MNMTMMRIRVNDNYNSDVGGHSSNDNYDDADGIDYDYETGDDTYHNIRKHIPDKMLGNGSFHLLKAPKWVYHSIQVFKDEKIYFISVILH